jgi:hypothetical protein
LQTEIAIENELHLSSADRSATRNVRTKHDVLNLPSILSIVVAMQKKFYGSRALRLELSSIQEGDMPASSNASSPPNIPKLTSKYYFLSATPHRISRRRNRKEQEENDAEFPFRPFLDALKRRHAKAGQRVSTWLCFPSRLRQFDNRPGCPCNAE